MARNFKISEHLLDERLTVVPEFHSHLEAMGSIHLEDMDKQISFSYIKYNGVANVISLPGPFPTDVDSTRYDRFPTTRKKSLAQKVR